ncbi:MAG: hypothetical protein A3F40_04290 [Chlamydiae bacterium RIFCSPHIGHO2_12_FULL_27_8]|nr:MAG: hypothetical protein A3F40_04290 [Chlamydiae bacterium RIFCSPHIGHO2_12_FULL_27_8]
MEIKKKNSSLVIGLALFAMFFGSGNLIYPLFVGTNSSGNTFYSILGFLLSAVALPFLGVIAMVLFKGDYTDFFSILGKKFGFLFSFILLTIWIPLGSAPRCIVLSYSSIMTNFNIGPLYIFSLFYSLLVFFVISRKVGFLNILGKYITPLLIGSILVIFIKGIYSDVNSDLKGNFTFFNSLVEGYNTMDLIASFFFSASIINILFKKTASMKDSIKTIVRSSFIGMFLLAVIYIALIIVSAKYSVYLTDVNKDMLLAKLSKIIFGSKLANISIIAIFLACFSTSIALVVAYSDFLSDNFFKNSKSLNNPVILSTIIAFATSLLGLEGITKITAPVLKISYPLLMGLIFYNIFKFSYLEIRKMIDKKILKEESN